MLYKSTPLEIVELKAGSEGMTFTAYASTFGNKDHGGDIIERGAFKGTIKDRNRDRPLLWQHNMDMPIGVEKSIAEDGKGLLGTWELVDTQQGTDAYKLIKRGAVRSMSIGYIPKTWEWREEGDSRVLREIDLLENSVVSIPMNDQARIQSVKTLQADDIAVIVQAVIAATQKRAEPATTTTPTVLAKGYDDMTLAELSSVVRNLADVFGTRTRDLLEKLMAGDYSLTEQKRSDLQTLLETFSSLDAVRSDAEALLRDRVSSDEEPRDELTEPSEGKSALALAIETRRRKLRLSGVEV